MALNIDRLANDTIAAIATGMTEAGIGIIRISGPASFECIQRIFRLQNGNIPCIEHWKAYTIHYGNIVDPDTNQILDEVLVSIFRAPRSYTTQDSIEINTHGGVYLEQKILRLILRQGVRMAEPGEFTKRAFLGGRIDLTRAEAVMDLIGAQNEFSHRTAMSQLRGSIANVVRELRERILYEIAFIESALDDPDNYDTDGYPDRLRSICNELVTTMDHLLRSAQSGRILKEGIRTVIIGRPNAGKSSLMNLLLGEERAIVTDIAGTTRDTLEESVRLVGQQGEILLHLIDTAGIHDTEDVVERIGIERAQAAVDQASLVLFLIDRSMNITQEDREIADRLITGMRQDTDRQCLVILNKSDLAEATSIDKARTLFSDAYDLEGRISFLEMSMIEQNERYLLQQRIEQMFLNGHLRDSSEILLSNAREIQEISTARGALQQVIHSIDLGMTEDFYSSDLMDAYTALGRILGETVEDDLVEEIFTRFCLGK